MPKPKKSSKKGAEKSVPAKRVHVVYKGRVQGVGFRFTVEGIAHQNTEITGWVRNLPDGDVEVTAEGPEAALKEFLDGVRASAVGKYIRKEAVDWQAATGEYADFRVEFVY